MQSIAEGAQDLRAALAVCYKRDMRELRDWMREKMRRRPRRGPNDSESTGKSGQELPANQPAPLRPTYPEPLPAHAPEPSPREAAAAEPVAEPVAEPAEPVREVAAPERKMVVETQPENPGDAAGRADGAKSPKGYVVLAIGLPGSGKTTWYKRRGVTPLSSDLLRTLLFDDITEQRYQGLVFSTLRSLLRARLIAKMPWNYVDATNLSPHERKQWIKMAKSFGYEVQAVFFDVPLAVCMERNSKRERVVTDEVMQKMAERLRPPTFKEGFEKITVVRVKGHAGSRACRAGLRLLRRLHSSSKSTIRIGRDHGCGWRRVREGELYAAAVRRQPSFLLRDISLRLEAGTTTALLGRSGSGKTTLLRMVNGLVTPTSGEVRVGGKAIGDV